MPIEIVSKKKTEPTCPSQHKALVPLRVVELKNPPSNLQLDRELAAGDILFVMPTYGHAVEIFNCTRGIVVDRRANEYLRVVRAYDVAQVVLSNDNEPAPLL